MSKSKILEALYAELRIAARYVGPVLLLIGLFSFLRNEQAQSFRRLEQNLMGEIASLDRKIKEQKEIEQNENELLQKLELSMLFDRKAQIFKILFDELGYIDTKLLRLTSVSVKANNQSGMVGYRIILKGIYAESTAVMELGQRLRNAMALKPAPEIRMDEPNAEETGWQGFFLAFDANYQETDT